ncbi:MAG TPA: NUDIX domain-containing protein [Azospirillum sp.]|nr:NUDIX domain-containing protein [Azospirillum sp.]
MNDPYLDGTSRLVPGDAVAAILRRQDGRYLMQLRDPKPEIFFPGHWGLFGGGIDPGEDEMQALLRELEEELNLRVDAGAVRYFTRIDFDCAFAGHGRLFRSFYEVTVDDGAFANLRLNEGRRLEAFTGREVLALEPVTPYDAFALWLHVQQSRLMRE